MMARARYGLHWFWLQMRGGSHAVAIDTAPCGVYMLRFRCSELVVCMSLMHVVKRSCSVQEQLQSEMTEAIH